VDYGYDDSAASIAKAAGQEQDAAILKKCSGSSYRESSA